MRKPTWRFTAALAVLSTALLALQALAADDGQKLTLRYRFHAGEVLRWDVTHRTEVDTTVGQSSQTAETTSRSVKVWRVTEVRPDGTATFEHLVERVDMRHKLSGNPEVRYNSQTDKKPPAGFANVACAVGVPLSTVTMDSRGKIVKRQRMQATGAENEGPMTIPLPEEPVAVGQSWSLPQDIDLANKGITKKIKAIQTFTFEGVKTGVATIRVATQILTPVDDPAIESQLIQREAAGTVRFDVEAGRIIGQQMDIDKQVVGFRGEASSLHYLNRFTEQLLPAEAKTAARPNERH